VRHRRDEVPSLVGAMEHAAQIYDQRNVAKPAAAQAVMTRTDTEEIRHSDSSRAESGRCLPRIMIVYYERCDPVRDRAAIELFDEACDERCTRQVGLWFEDDGSVLELSSGRARAS